MSVDDGPHHFLLPSPPQREFSYIEVIARVRSGGCPVTPGVSCPTSKEHFPTGGRWGDRSAGCTLCSVHVSVWCSPGLPP